MNFQIFSSRIKFIFIIAVASLFLSLGMLITFFVSPADTHVFWGLFLFWFAATSTITTHYLLWQNLPFLKAINVPAMKNYVFMLSILAYIALFPLLVILTTLFSFIFTIALFIMFVKHFFNKEIKTVNKEYVQEQYHQEPIHSQNQEYEQQEEQPFEPTY